MISRDVIQKLPKLELHRHLDGAVKPEVIFSLARKSNIDLPVDNLKELKRYYRITKKTSVEEIMKKFDIVISLMQTPENLQTIAYEQVRDLHDDNIVYAEVRFAPQYHIKQGLDMVQVIENVLIGMRKGYKEFGVMTNLIICIGRETESEFGEKVAQAALAFQNEKNPVRVVGIDLACDEATYPPERHASAYKLTFGSKLKRTIHAGEFGNQKLKNIKTAIELLCADRLGHAIPLPMDETLLRLIKEKDIGIESNPLSNVICHVIDTIEDLHLDVYLKHNIKFAIGSDDPAMMFTTLSDNLFTVCRKYNWGIKELKTIMTNAIEMAFITKKEKHSLKKKVFEHWPSQ